MHWIVTLDVPFASNITSHPAIGALLLVVLAALRQLGIQGLSRNQLWLIFAFGLIAVSALVLVIFFFPNLFGALTDG